MQYEKELKDFLLKLSEHPRVKSLVLSIKQDLSDRPKKNFTSGKELGFALVTLIAQRTFKKKQKMLNWLTTITLLIEISLILKENVFDRPEVKEFLKKKFDEISQSSQLAYQVISSYVNPLKTRAKK